MANWPNHFLPPQRFPSSFSSFSLSLHIPGSSFPSYHLVLDKFSWLIILLLFIVKNRDVCTKCNLLLPSATSSSFSSKRTFFSRNRCRRWSKVLQQKYWWCSSSKLKKRDRKVLMKSTLHELFFSESIKRCLRKGNIGAENIRNEWRKIYWPSAPDASFPYFNYSLQFNKNFLSFLSTQVFF